MVVCVLRPIDSQRQLEPIFGRQWGRGRLEKRKKEEKELKAVSPKVTMRTLRSKTTTPGPSGVEYVTEDQDTLGLDQSEDVISKRDYKKYGYPWPLRWRTLLLFPALHIGGVIGLILLPKAHLPTLFWTYLVYLWSQMGITAGNHRLWAHRTYKAKLPLRIFLMLAQSSCLQSTIQNWAVDHRIHHKYTDTDADPHNAKRGFFFSHIGWLFLYELPEYKEKRKLIDLSDLDADCVVVFQTRYFEYLCFLTGLVLPTVVPWCLWGEDPVVAFLIAGVLRCTVWHHMTFLVNSAAHIWGYKPYDVSISPGENIPVSMLACGEGFHNYHHVFPQDYRTSEHGWRLNFSTIFIDVMAAIGQATDRRIVSDDVIRKRQQRTGNVRKDDHQR